MPRGLSTGEPVPDDVSALLRAWTAGDLRARSRLTPIEVLHVSSITVMREWKSAEAWPYRELASPTANGQRTLEPRR